MNIFYAYPEQIDRDVIELKGQEAIHASKALRYRKGDAITVVDGKGGRYEGVVELVASKHINIKVTDARQIKPMQPFLTLAMGIIKKRDRLEFAVEKAVELGVQEIALFPSEHSVKQNIRLDRLQTIALSAMKQSLQAWLPKIRVFNSLAEMAEAHQKNVFLIAHQEAVQKVNKTLFDTREQKYVLLVGPEGGFSEQEMKHIRGLKNEEVILSSNRLRAETAAVTFLSQCRGLI